MTGVHRFSTNLGATSKLQVPEGCHKANFILRTHNSGVTCKPQCYLIPFAEDVRCHHIKLVTIYLNGI